MTVESTTTKARYEGNGAALDFPTGFSFAADAHVRAVLRRPSGDGYDDMPLTQGTDYTLEGAGTGSQGTLTYPVSGAPLAAGEFLTIYQDVPITQEKSWSDLGVIDTAEIEKADDKLTRVCLQLSESLERCVKMPVASGDAPADPEALLAAEVSTAAARDDAMAARSASQAAQAASEGARDDAAGYRDQCLAYSVDIQSVGDTQVGRVAAEGDTQVVRMQDAAASFEDRVEDDYRYIYVTQTGSDDAGDGSAEKPFKTVNAALAAQNAIVCTTKGKRTIRIVGYLEDHPGITFDSPQQDVIGLLGASAMPVQTYSSLHAVGTLQGDCSYAVVFNITDASQTAVGEFAIIEGVTPAVDADIKLTGCWEVTTVDLATNRVTLKCHDYSEGAQPGLTSTGSIVFVRDGIKFASGLHGIKLSYPGVACRMIQNLVLAGEGVAASNRYGLDLTVGCHTWLNGRVGFSGWHTGIQMYTANVHANDAVISACQYGAYAEGGVFNAANIQLTGCAQRGFRAQLPGSYNLDGGSKVIAACKIPIYAYYGAYVFAPNGSIAENMYACSPGNDACGNSMSHVNTGLSGKEGLPGPYLSRHTQFSTIPYTLNSIHQCWHYFKDSKPLVLICLYCIIAERGFSIGDRIAAPIGATCTARNMGLQVQCHTDYIEVIIGSSSVAILDKNSRGVYALTPANWRIEAYVWSE